MIQEDTIVAQVTPPGRGGVGIIRVSGPQSKSIAQAILGEVPTPRSANYFSFMDENKQAIDAGIALYFVAPHSFTGEDVLELQGHGGPVVMDCLLKRVLQLGARQARPGEFSERAFLNDKIDLAQAEAIADLIDAASQTAARSAIRSLQGEFSKKINNLVESLIQLRMYVEAAIDFPDEEIDFLSDGKIEQWLNNIVQDLQQIQQTAKQGTLLQEGMKVVIAGKPNAGKSSLLNQLSGQDSAIVTDIPGTTRDVLREYIQIDGLPLHIIDTAGLRESDDIVEQEGIRRATTEINNADCVLLVVDAKDVAISEKNIAKQIGHLLPEIATNKLIVIRNKIDLLNESANINEIHFNADRVTVISLSAKTGVGIEHLKQELKKRMGFNSSAEGLFTARRRHLNAIQKAHDFLLSSQQQLKNLSGELLAEDLRQAQNALSEITGEFCSDDLLGRIFSSFCIGK